MVMYAAAEEIIAVLAEGDKPWLSLELHTSTVSTLGDKEENFFKTLEHIRNVRIRRHRPTLCRVHPLVQADARLKANSRFACACFAYVSGCSLTIGAFTLGSGCSAHGCGCNYANNAYMFEEFVIYDNDQCFAQYIRRYERIQGKRRTRGSPAPASLLYPDAALLLVRSP